LEAEHNPVYFYRINQFQVESDIELPCEAQQARSELQEKIQPLRIHFRPSSLNEFARISPTTRAEDGMFRCFDTGNGLLFCAERHFKMHIAETGHDIIVDTDAQFFEHAKLYVLGVGLPVCTYFLGGLALHAACVDIAGNRIGIMAPSGVGKSTTMWALINQGAVFVADDLIPTELVDGYAMATPSMSLYAKLTPEAIEYFALDRLRTGSSLSAEGKRTISVPAEYRSNRSAPLKALFYLDPIRNDYSREDAVVIQRIKGGRAVSLVLHNLAAIAAITPQIDRHRLLKQIMDLLALLPLYSLSYPKRFDILPSLGQAISSVACGSA
jgi:hypothetical protein